MAGGEWWMVWAMFCVLVLLEVSHIGWAIQDTPTVWGYRPGPSLRSNRPSVVRKSRTARLSVQRRLGRQPHLYGSRKFKVRMIHPKSSRELTSASV